MARKELKALLAQGRVKDVIEHLLKLTKGSHLHNEVIQQSAKFKTYQQAKRTGISAENELSLTLNKINNSLLQIIDLLDESSEEPGISWWTYIARAGLVIGILAGIIASLKHLGFIGQPTSSENHSITVLVHGPKGKGDIVLPSRGKVYLIYGDAKIPEQINDEGEATFKQIDVKFFQKDASVAFLFEDPLGEPYRLRYPDSTYQLQVGQYIALEAMLEGMGELEGTVKDFVTGEPIDSVHIRIRGNSYYTNAFGEFTLDIPKDRQAQFIDLRFSKDGYESKDLQKVPTTTDQPQTILLKPL